MRFKIATLLRFVFAILLLNFVAFNSCKKVKNDGSNVVPPPRADSTDTTPPPTKVMKVTAFLVDSAGKPLPGLFYAVIPASIPVGFTLPFHPEIPGWTDSLGTLNAEVLSRTDNVLTVYLHPGCSMAMYTKSFAAHDTDINLRNIIMPSGTLSLLITGMVTSCNSDPIKTGTVVIKEDIYNIPPEDQKQYRATVKADGTFKFAFPVCATTDSVPVIMYFEDAHGLQVGDRVYYSLNYPGKNIEKIEACNNSDTTQFITYSFDSSSHTYYFPDNPNAHPENPIWTFFSAGNIYSAATQIYFGIDGMLAVGKPGLSLVEFDIDPGYGESSSSQPVVNITEDGPVGGYIAGNINLKIEKLDSNLVSDAKCSFRVKRKQ
jgi:hypothetical protein